MQTAKKYLSSFFFMFRFSAIFFLTGIIIFLFISNLQLIASVHGAFTIPSGYTHSGNTVDTIVGNPNFISGQPTQCPGTVVSFGIPKTLIPIRPWHGRPGFCVVPRTIVLHITASNETPEQTRDYFASGAGGRGSSAQFIIGRDGNGLQITETLADKVEVAYGVGGYIDDISIEMEQTTPYASKAEAPAAQYATVLNLVKALMNQYHIPLGNLQYNWEDTQYPLGGDPNLPMGIYGHYQLNIPPVRTDPGAGWLCDLRNDLGASVLCKHVAVL